MAIESDTGVVVETTTTTTSITSVRGEGTASSSQIENDSMDDQGIVAQEHDGLLQQAAHLSSTLARRRADLALMRAEAATVAISLEAAKHNLDKTLKDEAAIRAGAPSSPILNTLSRADFVPDAGLVRALRGQLDVTRSSVRDALSKRDALLNEIAALESSTPINAASEGTSNPVCHKSESDKDANSFRPLTSLGTQSLDLAPAIRYDPGYSPADTVTTMSPTLEQSILRLLDEGASSRSSFRSDHARIRRDNMPNLVLAREGERSHRNSTAEGNVNDDKSGGDEGDETRRSNDCTSGDTNGVDADVVVGVVTERVFEGVTCFTPIMEGSEVDTKITSKLDGRIHSFGPAFRPTDESCERVVDQYGVLRVPFGDRSGHVKIIAPKVALKRVCRLASDAVTRPSMHHNAYSVLNESLSSNHSPGTLSLLDLNHNTNSEKLEADISKSYVTSQSPDMIDSRRKAKSAPIAPLKPMFPTIRKTKPSAVLNDDQFAQVVQHGVPVRFHESTLTLLYSTDYHGMSLRTLYNKVHETSPTIVAILDTQKRAFGCYAAQPWKASATRYYGSGESFVFGIDETGAEARIYKWSRANSFFQFTSTSFLAIGGGTGSHFALWVDEDLFMGTTSACSTFSSPPLIDLAQEDDSSCNEFKILSLEVWGFRTGR